MTSRSERGGVENVSSDIVNQPVAYPDYYASSQGSGAVGGDAVPVVITPVTPVVPAVVQPQPPTVVVPQSVLQPCCPTGWMGTHTHDQSTTMMTPRSASTTTEMMAGETVTVCGESGVLVNRSEIKSFSGPVPLTEYPVNQDTSPKVVRKPADPPVVDYVQEVSFRYLRPSTPPPPGDIIIRQEAPFVPPVGPPIVIRQVPPRPPSPPVLVLREKPPKPVVRIPTKVVVIPARRVPPPPRKVIIEKIAPMPEKPQPIIVERWLGYPQQRRRVVFERHVEPESYYKKAHNTIIEWESPQVRVTQKFFDIGVVRANPDEYFANYSTSLKDVGQMPEFVRTVRPPQNVFLAADFGTQYQVPVLEGDLFALSFIDLEREGLGEYRGYLDRVGYGKGGYSYASESVRGESFLGRRLDEMPSQTVQPQVEKQTHEMSQGEAREQREVTSVPTEVQTTTTVVTKVPETTQVVREGERGGGVVTGGGTVEGVVAGGGDNKRREEVEQALRQVLERFEPRTLNRVSFSEAKEIIRLLNEKLNRSFDETQCERFLESMYFKRDDFMTLDAFRDALLQNI